MKRPKMTPEERKEAVAARKREEQERCRKWPGFILDCNDWRFDNWVQIRMEPGAEQLMIEIRKKGKWEKEISRPDVEKRYLHPSLEDTIEIIRALAVRYNAIVEDMNRTAAGIVIPEIRIVPQVAHLDADIDSGAATQ